MLKSPGQKEQFKQMFNEFVRKQTEMQNGARNNNSAVQSQDKSPNAQMHNISAARAKANAIQPMDPNTQTRDNFNTASMNFVQNSESQQEYEEQPQDKSPIKSQISMVAYDKGPTMLTDQSKNSGQQSSEQELVTVYPPEVDRSQYNDSAAKFHLPQIGDPQKQRSFKVMKIDEVSKD